MFGYARSPYRTLLRAAGCEMGDIRALVAREGVEGALGRLRDAGVFVRFDEFKGTSPAVRGSQTFQFRERDFDNPLLRPTYAGSTGGSRGAPTRTLMDLDYLTERAPAWCVWFEEHGLLTGPLVFLTPYNPGAVNLHLICAKFGNRFVRWLATARAGSLEYRLVARYLNGLVARLGRMPRAEFVHPSGLDEIGAYVKGLAQAGHGVAVSTAPSAAIRLARTLGADRPLKGATFLLGFEPLTRRRREAIEASGARVAMTYGFSEGGTLGQQCRQPNQADDVHIMRDAFAVIQDRDPDHDGAGWPLLLTSLFSTTPKVLLNTCIGDSGVLEQRRCSCLFDELGLVEHIHTIGSAHKMTGEGVTFLGPDLIYVLEDALPRRFGGLPTDFQLVELEGADGLARYRLAVNPALRTVDTDSVRDVFLAELARRRPPYAFMVEQWIHAGQLVVAREEPVLTSRGKFQPFRTLRRA